MSVTLRFPGFPAITTAGPAIEAIETAPAEPRELPCPGERGTAHRWLVMTSCHGPASSYGCQHCPATARGDQIGIDDAWLERAALARAASAS